MLDFFANLFGYVLNFIYNLTSNYGIAIILFTILYLKDYKYIYYYVLLHELIYQQNL